MAKSSKKKKQAVQKVAAAPSKPAYQIYPKNENQKLYLEYIERSDVTFGIGPAGTGKTYLAVAMAVSALNSRLVDRIIVARPAVEAGEKLGFLPGTMQEKVDPYMRPIYDALFDMKTPDQVKRMLENGTIEIAPLAFMRGRTLNNAFAIMDEAQNTTREQMKMFLTRLGRNSKAVVTGDLTQIDLPRNVESGLEEAVDLLYEVEGVGVLEFEKTDVVRHSVVQRIIEAYEQQ